MHMKSLVLVLGAGASKEVNLPVGGELKQRIAELLDIRFHAGSQRSGDHLIGEAFRLATAAPNEEHGDINLLLHASGMIRDAMPQAKSIDNFINVHRTNKDIAFCGKLAIVRSILQAEAKSNLLVDSSNIHNKINFVAIKNTWFTEFFQLLTENCQRDNLRLRLQQVAVVSFNYDRCFEHYLYFALQNYFGISAEEAADLLALLEVHHPYGKVGELPWMHQSGAVKFGAIPNAEQLLSVSKQLRTFAEGTDPSTSDIESIRAAVLGAQRLIFLGFAFHRLNLELLFLNTGSEPRARTESVFATALGLSYSDIDHIRLELVAKTGVLHDKTNVQGNLTCASLFHEYKRGMSLT